MTERIANITARTTDKLDFRAILLDLQLCYDRSLQLNYLWPGLPTHNLTDPDVLWRRNPELAISVAERNLSVLDRLLTSERRRATSRSDYRISDHALALRARAAEELILHLALRHAPPPSAATAMAG